MAKSKRGSGGAQDSEKQPYRINLPRFVTDEEIGLGDVIKRVTSTVGIKPCAGCERRAAALNTWLFFTGRRFK